MHSPLRTFLLIACIALIALPVSAQESDLVAAWLTLVNEARLDEGLAPYGISTLLTAAAQRHADDLATHGVTSDDVHVGSDGSTVKKRITQAGYVAWAQNDDELIVGENVWTGAIEDGLTAFLENPPQRENILNPVYREIGIGVADDENGQNYYVLTFGARPNVLPIFINDGAANTDNPEIAIRLTNEEFRPEGQGVVFMGQAIEIHISNEPVSVFEDLSWQSWEELVPWTLPNTPGEHTVYVQFRDAANRTAASTDSIALGEGAIIVPTATPSSPTAEATATVAPTAAPTTAPADTPTASATPVPPTPTSAPLVPSPSPLPLNLTPFPTWTPLPLPSPPETGNHSIPLGAVAALQGLALILSLYLALRRGSSRDDA
jgi:uncharacterized protein YkwD